MFLVAAFFCLMWFTYTVHDQQFMSHANFYWFLAARLATRIFRLFARGSCNQAWIKYEFSNKYFVSVLQGILSGDVEMLVYYLNSLTSFELQCYH
jgi:hypothetical protein